MGESIRVVVADDHPLFRMGVVSSLADEPDMAIVGQAADADEALGLARELLPDIVILDIVMPGGGLDAARAIAAACPVTKVVVLTGSADDDDVLEALKAGAKAYVRKGVSARELTSIVRAVHAGEVYVAPALAARLLGEAARPHAASPLDELTERERSILGLAAAGNTNREIAAGLQLSEITVKHYMTNILEKLQVRSRVEAALLAQQAGVRQER